jgi:glycosyltransferase involved in cell wall biosynthesis
MIDDLLFTPVVKRFMKAADYLLLPHESYNEHVEEFEKPILYLGTFIDDDVFNRVGAKELRRDKVNILLASTGFEGNLFFDTLKENLESKVGDRIALHIFGKGKILSVYELMEYFKSADICLNIAIPNKQYDSDFLNCKSEIKYAYCVHSETVIISHPTDPYMRAIEHGINGYLIKSDINLWVDTIASLVGSKELRKDITKEAKKDKKKYSLYGVNKRLIQQLKELGE